jgi:uncharacterized membrane protein YvbJ
MTTEQINILLSGLIFGGQIVMFFFFQQQIRSKNRVIKDFQTLIDTTDIKRLAEYYKSVDDLREQAITTQNNIHLYAWYKEHYAQWGNKFDEIASFTASILEAIPKEGKEDYINSTFPKCKEMFIKFFQDDSDNKASGFFRSVQNPPDPSQLK